MKRSSFQFSRPIIKNVRFDLNGNFNHNMPCNMNTQFYSNVIRNDEKNEAIVELNTIIGEQEEHGNPRFYLSLTIGAIFSWENEFDDETINSLLTVNAPSLLLGYARPVVANLTAPIGQYDLPFMNFSEA